MLPNLALRDGFSLWLDEIVGPSTVRHGTLRLDPFDTSLRNTARFAPWLAQLAEAQPISVNDQTQAIGDMARIGVVTGNHPDAHLTAMGERVLARWSSLSLISDSSPTAELARCAILYREGVRSDDASIGERYRSLMASYRKLVGIRPIGYWTQDVHHLYMPGYLYQADSRGYNPFEILHLLCGGDIGPIEQWKEWADQDWDGHEKLGRLLDKVKSFRPGGRRRFMAALEICLVADSKPREFLNLLTSRGYVNA